MTITARWRRRAHDFLFRIRRVRRAVQIGSVNVVVADWQRKGVRPGRRRFSRHASVSIKVIALVSIRHETAVIVALHDDAGNVANGNVDPDGIDVRRNGGERRALDDVVSRARTRRETRRTVGVKFRSTRRARAV